MVTSWPNDKVSGGNSELGNMTLSIEIITNVRNFRNSKGISPKEKLELSVKGDASWIFPSIISKLANLSAIKQTKDKMDEAFSFKLKNLELFIPMGANMNVAEEKERLTKELDYNKGFLQSVQKKLANERFVQNAKPEILDIEKKKQADAEAKIKAIEEQLSSLK